MRLLAVLIVAWLLMPTAGTMPVSAVQLLMGSAGGQERANKGITVPLKVAAGGRSVTRDPRLFSVPLRCNGVEAQFLWGCGGWTTVTETFARACKLEIRADRETLDILDATGQPMFLGQAKADIRFGDRQHVIDVKVRRDSPDNAGISGTIGYDIANQFQWQLDPEKLELILRELGTVPPDKVVASVPLKDEQENLWITLRCAGQSADLLLMPQSTDTQLTTEVAEKWGIKPATPVPEGAIVPHVLKGDGTALELADSIRESNLVVLLLPDVPNAQAGAGASLLNRFVYCVDARRKEMLLVSRVAAPGRAAQKR